MKIAKPRSRPGRPRAFNVEKALGRALQVFWQKGFEGATLADLTGAMGINRPSLYAAYGNKDQLFRKALDRYMDANELFLRDSINEPTARKVAEHLLLSAADGVTCPDNPRGCLTIRAGLSCGKAAESIRKELTARRAAHETAIRRRFARARKEGDLPADSRPGDLARYIATLMQGMSVQAVGGATRKELRKVAEVALRAWPK